MRVSFVIAGLVAAALPAAAARAQPAPPAQHRGLYLRVELGAAYARLAVDLPTDPPANLTGGEVAFAGAAGALNLAAGWAVQPNLILYGKLNLARASDPQLHGAAVGKWDGAATLRSFGGGAAYYFQPTNVYVGGSLLGSQVFVTDGAHNEAGNSRLGIGLEGQVGKEWWASTHWGVGLAFQLVVGTMINEDFATLSGGRWTALTGALLVTATYN